MKGKYKEIIRPQIGQKIKANACITKRRRSMGRLENYDTKLTWERWEVEVEGHYMGYRNVREGRIVYDDGDEQSEFFPERTVRAWLIVPNERMNAIYILPEDAIIG